MSFFRAETSNVTPPFCVFLLALVKGLFIRCIWECTFVSVALSYIIRKWVSSVKFWSKFRMRTRPRGWILIFRGVCGSLSTRRSSSAKKTSKSRIAVRKIAFVYSKSVFKKLNSIRLSKADYNSVFKSATIVLGKDFCKCFNPSVIIYFVEPF